MATETGPVKEATLRGVVERCRELFNKQSAVLNDLFYRSPKPECEQKQPSPTRPNVLDEVIDNLTELAIKQEELIKFSQSEIIHKI